MNKKTQKYINKEGEKWRRKKINEIANKLKRGCVISDMEESFLLMHRQGWLLEAFK